MSVHKSPSLHALIGLKEYCVANIQNDCGDLLLSERIYTPLYARCVFSYKLLMMSVHKSPSLYRRLVNHYNAESGFITVSKDLYHQLKPIVASLHSRFKARVMHMDRAVLSASRLVSIIASYSQSIPPYVRDYEIGYTNINIQRVDLLDE